MGSPPLHHFPQHPVVSVSTCSSPALLSMRFAKPRMTLSARGREPPTVSMDTSWPPRCHLFQEGCPDLPRKQPISLPSPPPLCYNWLSSNPIIQPSVRGSAFIASQDVQNGNK